MCAACYGAWKVHHGKNGRRDTLARNQRNHHYRTKFGVSGEFFDAMLQEQGGVCKICKSPPTGTVKRGGLHLDHCHTTGKIRGVLCNRCNLGLGCFRDRKDLLAAAAGYLQ